MQKYRYKNYRFSSQLFLHKFYTFLHKFNTFFAQILHVILHKFNTYL